MPVALVIGASRGIGREFVRQLLQDGWQVHATARDDAALAELRSSGAKALRVDVRQPESLAALGWELDGVALDLAIYAAGVYGPRTGAGTAPTVADFEQVMQANVLGAMQAIPLLASQMKAARGKFIVLTSRMGSIADAQSSAAWLYRTSKAALNMAVHAAAFDYPEVVLAAVSPGWVRTDMGGPQATLAVEESVRRMRGVIQELGPAHSGSFVDYAGQQLPW